MKAIMWTLQAITWTLQAITWTLQAITWTLHHEVASTEVLYFFILRVGGVVAAVSRDCIAVTVSGMG